MIAMQYKISLPDDYDMRIIQKRVQDNGNKTDGFQDLLFKAYLISEKGTFGNKKNEYAPLYLWKSNQGMNKFIFDGFYYNILNSFGWQQINIGIVSTDELKDNFSKSNYVLEIESVIPETQHMKALNFSLDFDDCTGKVIIYNPDKWRYVEFYFFEKVPNAVFNSKVYRLLHLSM